MYFRAFAAAFFIFIGAIVVLHSWTKRLHAIRICEISLSESRLEGIIGIIIIPALCLAISPLTYCIAGSYEGAEAALIASSLFVIPLLFFAGRLVWHSVILIFNLRDNSSGGTTIMEEHATCPMPDSNPETEEIREMLQNSRNIAIVGLSDNPEKDSNRIARYLVEKGFNVIPVNPGKPEILGRKCYPDLSSIPEKIDIVDIFRPVEIIPSIVDEAIRIGAKAVWMQLGLAHPESAEKARKAGLKVIQSKCIKVEHSNIFGGDTGISFNIR